MTVKIVVGVDGSVEAGRALQWCARYARPLDAEVVAVHAIDMPVIVSPMTTAIPIPQFSEVDRKHLEKIVTHEWCEPLAAADVPFRVVMVEANPALAIMETAKAENADLVVTGRRGRGGFAELLLGSTTNALTHHLNRPLVIIP
jgi:nucleotide-binding universal stress UspA family protein